MNLLRRIDVDYIFTLLFLLLASAANFLAADTIYWFVTLALMLGTAVVRRALTNKEIVFFSIFSAVYLVVVVLRDILVNDLAGDYITSDIVFFFKYVILIFVYVSLLKEKVVTYVVNVTVHLTVISFFFYFLQLIGLAGVVHSFSTALGPPHQLNNDEGYTNFVIFTLSLGSHEYSNCGFLWEPGAFGCFLVLTLLLHFFKNKFSFDGKAYVLIIGVLTTFSTTAYLGLFILLFLAYRVRVPKINLWLLLIIPAIVVLFITVPFLGDKIAAAYNGDKVDLKRLAILDRFYNKSNTQVPLGRFASMTLIYETFGNQLYLGVSNAYNIILSKKHQVNICNGVFDYMARFGLFAAIFLFYRFASFCNYYLRKVELDIYCVLILFVLAFGEPILILPIVLMFIFLPLTLKKGKEDKEGDNQATNQPNAYGAAR